MVVGTLILIGVVKEHPWLLAVAAVVGGIAAAGFWVLKSAQQREQDMRREQFERDMLAGILNVDERLVREIMTPRPRLVTVPAAMSSADALARLAGGPHTRVPVTDAAGETYTYRRDVDKQMIRTYRDGAPHSYDEQPAEIANPYGFVPAVWTMHNPTGGSHGDPALRNLSKIDEANSLAAHALDQAHRILEAPILIAGEQINSGAAAQKAGATNPRTGTGSAEDLKIVTAGAGARIEAVRLDPGEALEHVDRMLKEIEADHPEIGMYQQLRSMTQISGPAADRLFGDVAALVSEARTQYDRSTVKIMQMAVAIAGWRARSGAWGDLDSQQAKFAAFDLDSYQRGDLDIEIQARPLILPTRAELIALERAEIGLTADARYEQPETQPARIAERLRQAAQQQQTTPPARPQEAPAA
jgi:CBS domain-containing protein